MFLQPQREALSIYCETLVREMWKRPGKEELKRQDVDAVFEDRG